MRRRIYTENATYYKEINVGCSRKKYGVMSFLGDIIMVGLTGGLWLIWIFAREMRGR